MISPTSSPRALYHAIPQAPGDESDEVTLEGDVEQEQAELAALQALPVDPRISWIFFLLGCSVLLPWNVMITAIPFFLSRLANSSLKSTFSSYLSVSFTVTGFVFLAHATAASKRSSPSRQILATLLTLSFLTALLTLSTLFPFTGGLFFAFVLVNSALQAVAGAYLQTSVIAIASLFGPAAVQAMMSGQAAVAVVVSGVQVLSAAAFIWRESRETSALHEITITAAEERSASNFFALSTVFLLLCAAAHGWLMRLETYKIVAAPLEQHKAIRDANRSPIFSGRTERSDGKVRILEMAKANITYEVAIAYVFVVTIAVFPPITNSIQSTNPNTHPLLFSAIHFLVFGVGDLSGRYLCSFPRFWVWSAHRLLTISISRTLFILFFLMCNVQRPSSSVHSPAIISSDILFMLILLAFGMSNGYVTSMCMISVASLEHNPRLKGRREVVDVAATVATFFLVGGISLGSFASFAVRAAVCECNPFTS
ncbi:hypothetical protein L208DRAFT_1306344 [Tricholoma matsutake]|nr:hypothetical protein L208DRAFT_1306344 [Tricholoma matsutake 945]